MRNVMLGIAALAALVPGAYLAADEKGGAAGVKADAKAEPKAQAAAEAPEIRSTDVQAGDGESVASGAQNARLKHSQGGETTRNDATDMGVPMLPGSPKERQGPEDALGAGPTRGDYSQRIGPAQYHPHTAVPVNNPAPGEPNVVMVPQRQFAEEIGDAPGKGGVDTAEARSMVEGLDRKGGPAGE
jgi:hypothetical protein